MKIIITSLIIGIVLASSKAGLYKVKSPIDEEDRDKRSATVDVGIDLPTVSTIKITSTYSTTEGLKMTCEATGQNLSYNWTAQNGSLHNNEVADENVLSINKVTKENDRIFCCEAFNTAESFKKCVRLPVLVLTSDPLELIINSSAEIFCEVIGTDLKFDIKWKRADGLPLPNDAIVNDGLLKIPKLTKTDIGIYVCVGFLNDTIEAFHEEISLKVVSPPEILDLIITGLDGHDHNNVKIQCITQSDKTIAYKWKAHTEGSQDLRENEKAEGDYLSIYNFKDGNEGTFCCVTTNALGTRERCATIEPLALGMYHVVTLGSSIALECREFVGYSNMTVYWTREDGRQFSSNVVRLPNRSLGIRNISMQDRGRYKCTAKKGVLSASLTTIVEIGIPPVVSFISGINGNIFAKLGEKIRLTCITDGYPQPSVQWQKHSSKTNSFANNEPVTQKSGVYDIKSLSEKEAGLYACTAENSAGSSYKTVRVIIQ